MCGHSRNIAIIRCVGEELLLVTSYRKFAYLNDYYSVDTISWVASDAYYKSDRCSGNRQFILGLNYYKSNKIVGMYNHKEGVCVSKEVCCGSMNTCSDQHLYSGIPPLI